MELSLFLPPWIPMHPTSDQTPSSYPGSSSRIIQIYCLFRIIAVRGFSHRPLDELFFHVFTLFMCQGDSLVTSEAMIAASFWLPLFELPLSFVSPSFSFFSDPRVFPSRDPSPRVVLSLTSESIPSLMPLIPDFFPSRKPSAFCCPTLHSLPYAIVLPPFLLSANSGTLLFPSN